MLRPITAIFVAVLAASSSGLLLLAQPGTDSSGDTDPPGLTIEAPIAFTGRFSPGDISRTATRTDGDGVVEERGAAWTPSIVEMSEPMLDGRLIYMEDTDRYGESTVTLSTITYRIENENGAWQGTAIEPNQLGLTYTDNVLLVGEGDYEGLYAVMRQSQGNVEGVIFPAPPPKPSELP